MSQVWFVTGAARGLGRSIAEVVLQSGNSVVATARTPESLNDLVDQYGSDKVLVAGLDVTNQDQAAQVVESAVQKFGRIDVLVNNAGIAKPAAVEGADMQIFKEQIDINFYGVVNVTMAVIPVMRKQKSGHIMQLSTIGGRAAAPGLSAYSSAKWAITGFSQSLAQEVALFNINVTVVEPGGMKTGMADEFRSTEGINELYEPAVKAGFQRILSYSEQWTETVEAAKALLYVSKVENPPQRLLLGRETYGMAKYFSDMTTASDDKWKYVTVMSPEVIA